MEIDLTLGIALLSLLIALIAAYSTHLQWREASRANIQTRQLASGDVIMHFTDRFFDLLKDGDPAEKVLNDDNWAYMFWSLHATEFYFFHHGLLPKFMYTLWMSDLVNLYRSESGDRIRDSHVRYLDVYSQDYDAMCSFYEYVFVLSRGAKDEERRNRELSQWITSWYSQNASPVIK